jgi:hypothetical protein
MKQQKMDEKQFQKILHRCVNLPEPYKSEIFPPQLHDLLSQRTDIESIFILANKGELIFLVYLLRNLLSPEEYGRLFVEQWNYSENPGGIFGKNTPELWEGIPRNFMMKEEEMKVYNELPDIVTIYRGLIPKSFSKRRKQIIRGFSWTLDKDKAKWFALRYTFDDNESLLVTATILKEHIAFYCNDREEQEVVVNPKFLKIKSKERIKKETTK